MERLRHCRMGMDGACDILEESAHLKREDELRVQLSDVSTDCLDSENHVIRLSSSDSDESSSLLGLDTECTPAGS